MRYHTRTLLRSRHRCRGEMLVGSCTLLRGRLCCRGVATAVAVNCLLVAGSYPLFWGRHRSRGDRQPDVRGIKNTTTPRAVGGGV